MRRVALAFLMLTACGEGDHLVTRDEAIDIADDAVDASELSARIEDLEARLAEIERVRAGDARYMVEADNSARANDTWQQEAADRLFKNDRTMLREINRMRAGQGLQLIPEPDWEPGN